MSTKMNVFSFGGKLNLKGVFVEDKSCIVGTRKSKGRGMLTNMFRKDWVRMPWADVSGFNVIQLSSVTPAYCPSLRET